MAIVEPDISLRSIVTEVRTLIHTHGFDGTDRDQFPVPLRLREALKLALGEHSGRSILMLAPAKRRAIMDIQQTLEDVLRAKHGHTVLTIWLETADTTDVLVLLDTALASGRLR